MSSRITYVKDDEKTSSLGPVSQRANGGVNLADKP